MRKLFALLATVSLCGQVHRKPGSPLDRLPPNIEQITAFGERADISPDGSDIAFVGKSFGDAYAIDLKTRLVRCLTCHVPGSAFLRIMHLPNGDYLLIGPRKVDWDDTMLGRSVTSELWYMPRTPGSQPLRLGLRLFEGMAISKTSMKVSYAQGHNQNSELQPGAFRIFTAELDLSGPRPRLRNTQMVHTTRDYACKLEPQDFYAGDSKLTFACYETLPNGEERSQVMSLDLKTGQAANMSNLPGTFNEPEGIFPGGEYTLVESDRQARQNGIKVGEGWQIDLYKLRLDGSGKNIERLTYFNDYEGFHANNPVVSPDGRFMAFQVGRTGDTGSATGAGYGVFLYRFR